MDTLTHGVIGALAARSCSKNVKKSCVLITALAAAFPDIDYLLFWLNPYKFITEWHRGLTHSLIMLPLWGAMISLAVYWVIQKRIAFRVIFAFCCLGLFTHIATDLITLYGVQLFAPFSSRRYALFAVFDMDPWIGLVAVLGLLLSFFKRRLAIFGLLAILTYLLLLFNFQQKAQNILDTRTGDPKNQTDKSYAIPQPFIPFHWKLVIDRQHYYDTAQLSFYPKISKFINDKLQFAQSNSLNQANKLLKKYNLIYTSLIDFRGVDSLEWRKISKFGDSGRGNSLARQVWQQDAFAEFRNFASTPVLYRIDLDPGSECFWFTDLRYVFPLMMPPFRYGMCRHEQNDPWKLFRLRRHSENSRQLI